MKPTRRLANPSKRQRIVHGNLNAQGDQTRDPTVPPPPRAPPGAPGEGSPHHRRKSSINEWSKMSRDATQHLSSEP
ncbi:hypothetical protein ROHU_010832 [Labeo rohita]|uniref:Uncharacterized protein n=1 Tax=Labeo rohita TaxID=84645 RepID=A0A498LUE4_LABRO|nr:hypothetical protein ROHU_010832 [Labeo rohita]